MIGSSQLYEGYIIDHNESCCGRTGKWQCSQ